MSDPDHPRVVQASTGKAETRETDVSGPPQPVPDGFPGERPPHQQVHPVVPTGGGSEPADPGPETHPGKAVEDHDMPYPAEGNGPWR